MGSYARSKNAFAPHQAAIDPVHNIGRVVFITMREHENGKDAEKK